MYVNIHENDDNKSVLWTSVMPVCLMNSQTDEAKTA